MEKETNSILENFIPQLKGLVKSETVFGEPYTVGSVTLIPVNSVKIGFGFGSGEMVKQTANSGGGGGGVIMTPVAFIVIRDDQVTIQNLSAGTIENIIEKTPEFMERIIGLIQKTQKKKQDS